MLKKRLPASLLVGGIVASLLAACFGGTIMDGPGMENTDPVVPVDSAPPEATSVPSGEDGGSPIEGSFGAAGTENEAVAPFAGDWADTVSGRCYMTISTSGPADEAHIRIEWGDSAFETWVWTMTGVPSLSEEALYYEDCECRIVAFGEDGSETVKEVRYTAGSGSVVLTAPGALRWQDDHDPRSSDCRFERLEAAG